MSNTDFDPLSVEEPKATTQFKGGEPESPESLRLRSLKSVLKPDVATSLSDLYTRAEQSGRRAAEANASAKVSEAQTLYDAQRAYGTGLKQRYAAAEPQLMAPPPKFNVTKDSAEGMNALAVLLPIAGLIVGSKGMMSGVNAMNAMTGALEGYQKGNKERIDFETKKYEKAMEEWRNTINQVKESLMRYEKLAQVDLSEATAKAKLDAASKGYGVIKDLLDQQGYVKTIEIVQNIAEKAADAERRIQGSKLTAVLDKTTNQQTYVTQAQLAAEPQRYAPAPRSTDRGMNPSAAERKNYVGLNQMASTADELIKKLEDPEFAQKVQKYRLSAFLSEEGGKIASQVLAQKIPPDVQDFINKATRLRNQYYLEISGKAVTGGEAMRNYNVVPQPGDTPERLRQKLESLRDGARGDVGQFKQMYPRLPELTRGGTVVQTMPDQPTTTGGGPKTYEVGEVIEMGGKRYRTTTRGTDPDVEEIQ